MKPMRGSSGRFIRRDRRINNQNRFRHPAKSNYRYQQNRFSPSPRRRRRRSRSRSRSRSSSRRRYSPSAEQISPSPQSYSRDRSPSSGYCDREDDRDIRIKPLEDRIRDANTKLTNYRTVVTDLERRALLAGTGKARSDLENERLLGQLTNESSNRELIRKFKILQMQVQTQAVLLRKFHGENAKLKEENDFLRNFPPIEIERPVSTHHEDLKLILDRIDGVKDEWISLRKEIGSQLSSFNTEFEDVRGHVFSILDMAVISQNQAQDPLRTNGKIVVEQRHLKQLLETIVLHTKAVAQGCIDAVNSQIKDCSVTK